MFKKFILFVLILSFITVPAVGKINKDIEDTDEEVTFIVEVYGDPSLANNKACNMGISSYSKTSEYKNNKQNLLSKQNRVLSDIKKSLPGNVKKGYEYTKLFNGFSIKGNLKDKEKLLNIEGIKNVYVSKDFFPVMPEMNNATEIGGMNEIKDKFGYSGKGEAIAIIDSEFDCNHEFLSSDIIEPKYSKENIDNILKTDLPHIKEPVDRIYKNNKIPFAYDYGESDSDTYSKVTIHGTHVAGITAGKNGHLTDGTLFSGVAPEAQLILFKVTNNKGSINMATVLKALEDATNFDVASINLSLGRVAFGEEFDPAENVVFNTLKNLGISVCAAIGNESRGYKEKPVTTDLIDYASGYHPGTVNDVTAVAASTGRYTGGFCVDISDKDKNKITDLFIGTKIPDNIANLENTGPFSFVNAVYNNLSDYENLDLKGKIVFLKSNLYNSKMLNLLEQKGAAMFICWTDIENALPVRPFTVPGLTVTKSKGQILFDKNPDTVFLSNINKIEEVEKNPEVPTTFTSWGTTDSLNLKPEIMAPGKAIYSSMPDNSYAFMNGTSMATPYMSGVYALLNEFYKTNPYTEKYNNLTGRNKVTLLENIAMSSATITKDKDTNVCHSPRQQGAGLINLKKAVNTPAILKGSNGKTKLNLKDKIDDNFTLDFTVSNISKNTVTYDKISLYVMTDDYYYKDGKTYIGGMKNLKFTSPDLNKNITLNKDETKPVTLNVTLDKKELTDNEKIFTNGFYIDGYVVLENTSNPDSSVSIPFAGFRGDFAKEKIFDKTMYEEGGSILNENDEGTYLVSLVNYNAYVMGTTYHDNTNDLKEKNIVVSPDGNGMCDNMILCYQLLRSGKNLKYEIINDNNEVITSSSTRPYLPRFLEVAINIKDIPTKEGKYTLKLYSSYYCDDVKKDSSSIDFYVDMTPPEIISYNYDKETKNLEVTAKDNHLIASMAVSNTTDTTERFIFDHELNNNGDIATATFNLEGVDLKNAYLTIDDYGGNEKNVHLPSFLYNVLIDITNVRYIDGLMAIDIDLYNKNQNNINSDVIIGYYDKSGALIYKDIYKNKLLTSKNNKIEVRKNMDISPITSIKFYVWDSLNNLKPLSENNEISLVHK